MSAPPPFWEAKSLSELTRAEWESLCDGCGRCCLHKLEDADTGEIHYTNVACKLLDLTSCACSNYERRWDSVPDCIKLSPRVIGDLAWLPSTCAYRLLREGRPLPAWHPLVSGDPDSIHRAGISVRGRAVRENRTRRLERHIVSWPA
ncbi:MAG: hypothetical protein RLZZ501_343 [Pseudomonadota bacterium]|jgi:uncharacterized cysteine cluster protein YcgN (CxxCxxCC family)